MGILGVCMGVFRGLLSVGRGIVRVFFLVGM